MVISPLPACRRPDVPYNTILGYRDAGGTIILNLFTFPIKWHLEGELQAAAVEAPHPTGWMLRKMRTVTTFMHPLGGGQHSTLTLGDPLFPYHQTT